jgi:hypothetical protein
MMMIRRIRRSRGSAWKSGIKTTLITWTDDFPGSWQPIRLASSMERALNSQNINSPSSRIMKKATACTDRVTQLRASGKKMMKDGDPQEEIDEVTASIKQYMDE